MKRFLAWIAGGLAVYRLLRRRRRLPAASPSPPLRLSSDPRAEALRAKLDEPAQVVGTQSEAVESAALEADVPADTPVAEAEAQLTEEPAAAEPVGLTADSAEPTDPDGRRRSIQQEAKAAIEQMRSRS